MSTVVIIVVAQYLVPITIAEIGSTRYWNDLEDYWPHAGGRSAVNAIGTQLRDLISSGLTRRGMAVSIK